MFRCAVNCLLRENKSCSFPVLFDLAERLTFQDVQSPQEFRHGDTAEVVCDVISSPVPVVVWYYQDREITEEHHSKCPRPFVTFLSSLLPFWKLTTGRKPVGDSCTHTVNVGGMLKVGFFFSFRAGF